MVKTGAENALWEHSVTRSQTNIRIQSRTFTFKAFIRAFTVVVIGAESFADSELAAHQLFWAILGWLGSVPKLRN